MRRVFHAFNYREVATPTFEELELFLAKSGPGIREEIYEFEDKSGRKLCLRPELTAPVMRFYFGHLRSEPKPLRLFYVGPCYRYDRPQAGRYREFWQVGCELVGDDSPEAHAELLHLALRLFEEAGVARYQLRLGHLGILRSLLAGQGVAPAEQGPLMRLIDKKDLGGLEEALRQRVGAPKAAEFLRFFEARLAAELRPFATAPSAGEALAHLERVLAVLQGFGADPAKIQIDPTIARGLEYYTGFVFELDAPDLGAEKQLLGGGAYDLSGVFGESPVAAVGFALGFDRTLVALEKVGTAMAAGEAVDALVAALAPAGVPAAQRMANRLRELDLCVELDLSAKGAKRALSRANQMGARAVVLLGEQEVADRRATVKDLASGEQVRVSEDAVAGQLAAWRRSAGGAASRPR